MAQAAVPAVVSAPVPALAEPAQYHRERFLHFPEIQQQELFRVAEEYGNSTMRTCPMRGH
jgi:hypothetical protein